MGEIQSSGACLWIYLLLHSRSLQLLRLFAILENGLDLLDFLCNISGGQEKKQDNFETYLLLITAQSLVVKHFCPVVISNKWVFILHTIMLLFQKEPNQMYYTTEKMYCSKCGKRKTYILEIKNKWLFCKNCFQWECTTMIDEFYLVRGIQQVIPPQAQRKIERSKMTLKKRYEILKRDNFQCVLCWGRENLEIDHKIPISEWWKSIKENLQTLCFKCNRGKGTIV